MYSNKFPISIKYTITVLVCYLQSWYTIRLVARNPFFNHFFKKVP